MNRHTSFAMLMVFFLTTVPLHARTHVTDISESGNRYVEICSSTEKPPEKWNEVDFVNLGLCYGFTMGFHDGSVVAIAVLHLKNSSLSHLTDSMEDLGICIPDRVEKAQLVRVVLKYIREHPEQAHEDSATLAFRAEFQAFPCSVTAPAPRPKQ